MVELGTEATSPGLSALPGDTLAARSVRFTAKVTGGLGQRVRFVRNGTPEAEQDVTRDPFVASFVVAADAARETRVRAEVLVDEKPRTVTSHVFLRFDAQGPEAASAAGDEDLGGGCSVGSSPKDGTSTPLVAFAPLAAGLVRLVLRRRAVHDRLRK
jgi:hypothetical protein